MADFDLRTPSIWLDYCFIFCVFGFLECLLKCLLTSCYYSVSFYWHLSRLKVLVNFSSDFDFLFLLFLFYLDFAVVGSIVLVRFFLLEKAGYFLKIFIWGVNVSYEVTWKIRKKLYFTLAILRLFEDLMP